MLHTKLRGNRSTCSGKIFEGVYHIWAWRSSWTVPSNNENIISVSVFLESLITTNYFCYISYVIVSLNKITGAKSFVILNTIIR